MPQQRPDAGRPTLMQAIWRVIAAIPPGRVASPGYLTQISRLRAEGIVVNKGRVDMRVYRWVPRLDELLWGPMPDVPDEIRGD